MIITYPTVNLQCSYKKVQSTKKVKQIFQTKKDFITSSKLIINELVGFPIRSENIYFADKEQTAFFITHAEHNLIKLKFYNN